MGLSKLKQLQSVMFAVTEDWYFWSHRKPLADYLRENGAEGIDKLTSESKQD